MVDALTYKSNTHFCRYHIGKIKMSKQDGKCHHSEKNEPKKRKNVASNTLELSAMKILFFFTSETSIGRYRLFGVPSSSSKSRNL